MTPLWQQRDRLDYEDNAGQRTSLLEWLVLAVGLVEMAAVTGVAVWLW